MKLWEPEKVQRVMETAEFKKAFAEAEQRRQAAKESAEKRKNALIAEAIEKVNSVEIPKYKENILRKKTLAAKQEWYDSMLENPQYGGELRNVRGADDETINRWIVNFLRHGIDKYDYDLNNFHGKVGVREAYCKYKERLLERIREVYPKYAAECERQIANMWDLEA